MFIVLERRRREVLHFKRDGPPHGSLDVLADCRGLRRARNSAAICCGIETAFMVATFGRVSLRCKSRKSSRRPAAPGRIHTPSGSSARSAESVWSVVLANPDLIGKLGVAVPFRFPAGHLLTALSAAVFASFRSCAALQLEILALRHHLGVSAALRQTTETDPDRSIALGLAIKGAEPHQISFKPTCTCRGGV